MDLAEMWKNHKEEIIQRLKEQTKEAFKNSDLKGFEKPFYILVSPREMTVDNNCMTPTFKVKRNFAKKFWLQEIKDM